MDVDPGADRFLAIDHDRAGQGAEPCPVKIKIDTQNGKAARNAARNPGSRKSLAEDLNGTIVDRMTSEQARDGGDRNSEFAAGDGALAGAECDGRYRFDDLRETEEQNE